MAAWIRTEKEFIFKINDVEQTFDDEVKINPGDIIYIHIEREDDYSTSVMSIQFRRTDGKVDIISRYNHHGITAPNSVWDCNLEKIAPGLTKAFEKEYGLKAS